MAPEPMSRDRRATASGPTERLRTALAGLAEVRGPHEAEEPILAPPVRQGLFAWLAEINAANELRAVGIKPRATALLHGPPGCGKTTLAHHVAARLGLPMAMVGAENIMKSFLGESEGIVAKLFDRLESAKSPCVLFLDELEAIGGKRDNNTRGGADNARTSILTVLLRRIETYGGFAIAATNRPQDIDPALWRRFHLQIEIALPTMDERFAILRRYAAPFILSDEDTDRLADLTEGASPALLRGLMEGLKRALVINPRIRQPVDDLVQLARTIIVTLRPPPEMQTPALWAGHDVLEDLRAITWPPARQPG